MPPTPQRSPLAGLVAPFAVMAAVSLALGMQTPPRAGAGSQVLADGPVTSQTVVPSPSSQAAQSAQSAQPSASPTAPAVTVTPAPPLPPQLPPLPVDPLEGLSKKEHKAFTACLTQVVDAHSSGRCAALAMSRLKQAGFSRSSGSSVGAAGANALLNYQRSRGLTATGTTTRQTWISLATKAKALQVELPAKCLGAGVNLCVNQGERRLYFLRDGKVERTFKVRLGGYNVHPKTHKWRVFPTANGSWRVFDKQVNPKSDNYGSGAMPYSVMFHPDMYVHYSPGFHAVGYASSSHGCVNIGQLSEAIWIYKHTPVGARVTVFTPKAAA